MLADLLCMTHQLSLPGSIILRIQGIIMSERWWREKRRPQTGAK